MIRTGTTPEPRERLPEWLWHLGLLALLGLWWAVYRQLPGLAETVTALLPVERTSRAGEAVAFFLSDAPKVLMLLTLAVFVMGVVRTWFSAERTRALLAGRRQGIGNLRRVLSIRLIAVFVGTVAAGIVAVGFLFNALF